MPESNIEAWARAIIDLAEQADRTDGWWHVGPTVLGPWPIEWPVPDA
jgi:hypothetical protein